MGDGTSFKFDKDCFSQMRVIGQFNLGFIIAALRTRTQDPAGEDKGLKGAHLDDPQGLQLFIIDQHASDEKFRFEALNRESKIDRQPLVNPHHLQLTPAQEQLAESHMEVFRLNGFELQQDDSRPPGRRLRLATLPSIDTSAPATRGMIFGERDVHDLLYDIQETEAEQMPTSQHDNSSQGGGLLNLAGHRALWSSTGVPRPKKIWQMLACRACRGAIMIGKALRVGEMERILANLGSLQQPWNCPHGRPTMRHLTDAGAARRAPRPPPPLEALLAMRV